MQDDERLFVVTGMACDENGKPLPGARQKFWTGRMNESWPEYLGDLDRAAHLKRAPAKEIAAGFNQRVRGMRWKAEPLEI